MEKKVFSFAEAARLTRQREDATPETTPVLQYSSTPVVERELEKEQGIETNTQNDYSSTPVVQYSSSAIPTRSFYKKANQATDELDRHLAPAESKVFEHIIRLTVGLQREWCQVTIRKLLERTGYKSDKTVADALKGLVEKGIVERRSTNKSPLGDKFRVLQYSSTDAKSTPVLESKITDELKTGIKREKTFDDEAQTFLKQIAAIENGDLKSDPKDIKKIFDILIEKYKKAKLRSKDSITDPLAFLAKDLKRAYAAYEGREVKEETKPNLDLIAKCTECDSSGLKFVSDGEKSGMRKCEHPNLKREGN